MPKNVKGDPLGFFNIHSVAKHQKIEGGPFEDFKKIRKKSHIVEKRGGESLITPKNWKRTLLGFAVQGRGLWMRLKSSTEYFW